MVVSQGSWNPKSSARRCSPRYMVDKASSAEVSMKETSWTSKNVDS